MGKAQVTVEFLMDFLLMLALISLLLGSLSRLLSTAEGHSAAILEKARVEEFARSLDALEMGRGTRISAPPGYSMGDGENAGVIVGRDGKTLGYTIYGMGGDYGEPV